MTSSRPQQKEDLDGLRVLAVIARALFILSAVGGALFLTTYEFPAVVGFAEFPYGPKLTRNTLLRDATIAGLIGLASWVGVLGTRKLTPLYRKGTRLLLGSLAIWLFVYMWEPIARTVWGEPFTGAGPFEYGLAFITGAAFSVGVLRVGPWSPHLCVAAVLAAAWVKPDMSLDRLIIASLLTAASVIAFYGTGCTRTRPVAHLGHR